MLIDHDELSQPMACCHQMWHGQITWPLQILAKQWTYLRNGTR